MKKFLAAGLSSLALLTATSAAQAQAAPAVSGGAALKSQYIFDLFVLTDEPVVQAWASLPLGERCSAETWGSRGVATGVGAELDVGLACSLSLSEKTEVEVSAFQYFMKGYRTITDMSVKVTHGPIDVMATYYHWRANEDATRVEAGYTLPIAKQWSVRATGVYETGFDLPDIIYAGAELEYTLTDNVSLDATVYTPLRKGAIDDRGTEVIFGISYNF